MYRVIKANIIKDGKTVGSYDLNIETEDLESVKKDIIQRHLDEYRKDLSVYLQYKDLSEVK